MRDAHAQIKMGALIQKAVFFVQRWEGILFPRPAIKNIH